MARLIVLYVDQDHTNAGHEPNSKMVETLIFVTMNME